MSGLKRYLLLAFTLIYLFLSPLSGMDEDGPKAEPLEKLFSH